MPALPFSPPHPFHVFSSFSKIHGLLFFYCSCVCVFLNSHYLLSPNNVIYLYMISGLTYVLENQFWFSFLEKTSAPHFTQLLDFHHFFSSL